MVVQEITDPLCDNHISGTTSVDFLAISSIIESYNRFPNMVTITLTAEEATAYVAALERATDNPFIQDDDECSPLFTLQGHIEGALYNTSSN